MNEVQFKKLKRIIALIDCERELLAQGRLGIGVGQEGMGIYNYPSPHTAIQNSKFPKTAVANHSRNAPNFSFYRLNFN